MWLPRSGKNSNPKKLDGGEEGGEKGGAGGHCRDEDVFVGGVGAGAYCAEAVEGGDAQRGG